MRTRIQKWGNSQGLRVSKDLLVESGLEVGEEVELSVLDDGLLVRPTRRVRGGHDLRDLVARIPSGYEPGELDWGAPAGGEEW